MFKLVKHSVAVGNAKEQLKAVATFLTDSSKECGVATVLDALLQFDIARSDLVECTETKPTA